MDSDDDFELEEIPKAAKKRRLPKRKSKENALQRMRK